MSKEEGKKRTWERERDFKIVNLFKFREDSSFVFRLFFYGVDVTRKIGGRGTEGEL